MLSVLSLTSSGIRFRHGTQTHTYSQDSHTLKINKSIEAINWIDNLVNSFTLFPFLSEVL